MRIVEAKSGGVTSETNQGIALGLFEWHINEMKKVLNIGSA
jgi:hypothetical protein